MTKLTDTQLIVLSRAAQREDGVATAPEGMNKPAAAKVGASLLARGMLSEVPSKAGMPAWRTDEDGRGISLVLTSAGRSAINVGDEAQAPEAAAPATEAMPEPVPVPDHPEPKGDGESVLIAHNENRGELRGSSEVVPAGAAPVIVAGDRAETAASSDQAPDAASKSSRAPTSGAPRSGSKQALVIGMLSEGRGVTLDALVEATGWLPHTARAALTGLRKRGYVVERSREADEASLYRISSGPDISHKPEAAAA